MYLIRQEKVGFMVDAGIHGFALGTGFALIENFYYALSLGSADPLVWLVRGLGTAVMHGSVTAIVGIVSKDPTDRHESVTCAGSCRGSRSRTSCTRPTTTCC